MKHAIRQLSQAPVLLRISPAPWIRLSVLPEYYN